MWSRRLALGVLLVGGCQAAATTGDLDSIEAPRRGSTADRATVDGGGGGPAGSADGGAVAGEVGGGSGDGAAVESGISNAVICPGGTRDLSNVGAGDFRIAFRIATKQTGWAALMNQRTECAYGMFWDLRQSGSGTLMLELDGSGVNTYETLESTIAVNDGKSHEVLVARSSGTLAIEVDGAQAGLRASSAALSALPSLRVSDDICVGVDTNPPTAAFAGMTLSDLCISRGH